MKPRLRVALLGAGFMGKTHSNAYRQAGFFFELPFALEMAVLCGRDPEATAARAAQWGWSEAAADWRAVVARPDIDLVDIATPNALHAEMAIAAARAGKAVMIEKPLALNETEAEAVAAAVREIPNGVWFNYRRAPAVQLARQIIDEGRIGQVFHYRAVYLQEWGLDPTRRPGWKLDPEAAGGGVIPDLLSHAVDLALWLNGPIAEVQAMQATFAAGRRVEDAATVLVRFENGSLGTFEASRFATGAQNRNQFEIHGERGMLRYSLEDFGFLDYFDAAAVPAGIRRIPAPHAFWKPGHVTGYEHTFIAALADFLTAFARGERFRPDAADALEVQRVLERIQRGFA
jgi:predicted dehydrogenase